MFRRDPLRQGLMQVAELLELPQQQARAWLPLGRSVFRLGGVLGVARHNMSLLVPLGGVQADGLFELASVTKPFTAALAEALVRQGKLGWDERISMLGGPLRGMPAHLTARSLATHTAGLPGHPARTALTSLTRFHDPYGGMSAWDVLASARRWAKPQRLPRFLYSNLGVGLLALALAQAAGEDLSVAGYGAALERYVTAPLGLADVGLSPDQLSPDQSRLVTPRGLLGGSENTGFGPLVGAGGLYGTAADLLRFGQAHPSGLAGLHWQAANRPPDLPFPRQAVAPGWFYTPSQAGGNIVWHDGVARGTRTALGFCPETGTVVTILARGGVPVLGMRAQVPLLLLQLLGANFRGLQVESAR